MSGTCNLGPDTSFGWSGKWAGGGISAPEPHIILKLDIRHCFGTPDAILASKYFFDPHTAHGWPFPGQASGPEEVFQPPNHI